MILPRDPAEKLGHFFKALAKNEASRAWCRENGVVITRAAGEGLNTAGGFLVPQDFDSVPIDVMPATGAFRRGTVITPTTSDYLVRPRLTGSMTGYWVNEGTAITESQVLLSAMQASPARIATLTRVPSELMEDSATAIADWLVPEIRWALDSAEDDAAWNGDGTSTYGHSIGLATALSGMASGVAAAGGHNTYATLDATDLANLIGAVEPGALPTSSWIVNSAAVGLTFSRLSVSAGNLIARQNPDGTYTLIFMGWPILLSNKMPDVTTSRAGLIMMAFGDLRKSSALVERQPTTVSISYGRYLDQDQVAIRASRRVAVVHHSIGTVTVKAPIACLFGTT